MGLARTIPVPDLIETNISQLSFSCTITGFSNTATTTVIETCNTGHVRPFSVITIDSIDYNVVTVVYNESIEIDVVITPVIGSIFSIVAPYYFHGTTKATSGEVARINDTIYRYPMVYVYEPIREIFNNDYSKNYDREVDLRIFFLDEANFADWSTDEHYLYVINPMRNLVERFVNGLENDIRFSLSKSYEIISHAKIGQLINQSGHLSNLFSDNASGAELKTKLLVSDKCDPNSTCVC